MKILITGTTGDSMPPPYGGIPKVSLLYAREWKKMGHDVALTFVYRPDNADDFGANAEYFFEYSSKPNKLKKALFLIRYFFKNPFLYINFFSKYYNLYPRITVETILYSAYGVYIDRVVSLYKPDVILSEAALIKTFMVTSVANKRRIPVVIDTYAEVKDPLMGVNKHLNEVEKRKYWVSFLNMAELVLGISNCSVGAQKYLPNNKTKAFYDTCDFSRCRMELNESKVQLREYLRLPKDMFLVGAVGAFELRKGHDHLIKTIAILHKKGHNVGAAICGGSGDVSKWKMLAEEEKVLDKVFFFSRLSEVDLVKFYRSLDVYSNLSNSERSCGLDLALLEGMASGNPLVVYDNGGLKEAIPEGKNGFVVKTGDIEAVGDAIVTIMNFPAEERKNMGDESVRVASKCDIELTSKVKLGWLQEVINNYKK
jgi:glycosyltransferase involved in cell wall biosynthesis